ncbi:O-antigen ligase family protein [Vibrio scophthalmi]|uniref:Putative O-antigen ligase n=1 Tax=Vibrio scophthalmi LMG 19158 TaxID=870967 RepID=F9RR07_9VIBR|nr:O-antigen ligase family protein [Vibrio scophthalmi]EGU33593.1 putative O-antigen ligase [Vibrio scophthalmi LMG 19158]
MNINNHYKKNTIQFLFALPTIWAFSGLFLYEKSDKHFFTLCIIVFFLGLFQLGFNAIVEQIKNRKLTWILLIAVIFSAFTKLTMGGSSSELRVLGAIALYSMVLPNYVIEKIKSNLIFLIALASIISVSYISYQTFALQIDREYWSINAIPYTTFSAAITSIAIYLAFISSKNKQRITSLFSACLGLSSIIISQTRGTLLAVTIAALLIAALMIIKYKKNSIFIVASIIAISLVSFLNHEKIEQRIIQTKHEYHAITSGNLNTSIGYRLQMWKAGWELAKSPTIFGLGKNHVEAKQELYEKGLISKASIGFKHYHNQYISSLVMKGIVGLMMTLAFLLMPLFYYFWHNDKSILIAILCSTVYAVSGLTDIPLMQPHPLAFYLIILLLFCTQKNYDSNTI